jgi:hypothetical protein
MPEEPIDRHVGAALRRLREESRAPEVDAAREAALLAAYDRAHANMQGRRRRQVRWLATLAAAAAVLIAVTIESPRRATRETLPDAASEFTIVPGAAALPPLESGSLVRTTLPVSVLPSLGVSPPAQATETVKADLIVGQDGLARAVRLVD